MLVGPVIGRQFLTHPAKQQPTDQPADQPTNAHSSTAGTLGPYQQ